MKLAVGYPWSSAFSWTGFTDSMLNLQRPRGARNSFGVLEAVEVRYFRGAGWCPARRHAHICEQALDWGADLICIVGADQLHPEDMLDRLIQRWNEGCEVVTALVPARGYVGWQDMKPFQAVASRFKRTSTEQGITRIVPREFRGQRLDGDMVEIIDPKDGDLQKINFIGSGVLMFHRDHLLALKKPWFMETIDPETYNRRANMDVVFVWRLQTEAQAQVWCDTTIKVKHLHAFEIDESFTHRFDDWMEPGMGDPALCRYPAPEKVG